MRFFTGDDGNVKYLLDTGSTIVTNTVSKEDAERIIAGRTIMESDKYPPYNMAVTGDHGETFYFQRVKLNRAKKDNKSDKE